MDTHSKSSKTRIKLGSFIWATAIQYYVVQLVVAAAWDNTPAYSWRYNTISDLANTVCGPYGLRIVCSPLHPLMNLSFVVLGLSMIGGALLLSRNLANGVVAKIGLYCMAAAGIGVILVGLFPENSISLFHTSGAGLSFIFGNIAMIITGFGLRRLGRSLRIFSVALGVIGLVSLVLFMTHAYLGLGIGGMERIVAYPQSIWMIIIGLYLLRQQYSRNRNL